MVEGMRSYDALCTFEGNVLQHLDQIQHRFEQQLDQYLESFAELVANEEVAKCAAMVDSEGKAPELSEQEESAEVPVGNSTCDHRKATTPSTVADESSKLKVVEEIANEEALLVEEHQQNFCSEGKVQVFVVGHNERNDTEKHELLASAASGVEMKAYTEIFPDDSELVAEGDQPIWMSWNSDFTLVSAAAPISGAKPVNVMASDQSWSATPVKAELVLETKTPFAKLWIRCSKVGLHLFDEMPQARIILVFDPGGVRKARACALHLDLVVTELLWGCATEKYTRCHRKIHLNCEGSIPFLLAWTVLRNCVEHWKRRERGLLRNCVEHGNLISLGDVG